jgi:hypothetical protein
MLMTKVQREFQRKLSGLREKRFTAPYLIARDTLTAA